MKKFFSIGTFCLKAGETILISDADAKAYGPYLKKGKNGSMVLRDVTIRPGLTFQIEKLPKGLSDVVIDVLIDLSQKKEPEAEVKECVEAKAPNSIPPKIKISAKDIFRR